MRETFPTPPGFEILKVKLAEEPFSMNPWRVVFVQERFRVVLKKLVWLAVVALELRRKVKLEGS